MQYLLEIRLGLDILQHMLSTSFIFCICGEPTKAAGDTQLTDESKASRGKFKTGDMVVERDDSGSML